MQVAYRLGYDAESRALRRDPRHRAVVLAMRMLPSERRPATEERSVSPYGQWTTSCARETPGETMAIQRPRQLHFLRCSRPRVFRERDLHRAKAAYPPRFVSVFVL